MFVVVFGGNWWEKTCSGSKWSYWGNRPSSFASGYSNRAVSSHLNLSLLEDLGVPIKKSKR